MSTILQTQYEEKRFALRMALRLPIVVSGRADDGAAWSEPTETDEFESMAKRETLELVRAYYRINDPNVRRRAFELIKALGGEIREAEPVVA